MERKSTSFLFNKDSKIILYGAASIGILLYRKLNQRGYNIIGFVDKRAEEIQELYGLPVWALDTVPNIYSNDEVVFFVSIKNVFEHDEVVQKIIKRGYHNIIYKSFAVLNGAGSVEEKYISDIYSEILNEAVKEQYNIPQTVKISRLERDFAIIEENHENIVAYIPVDYIYTNHYENGGMQKWSDINVLAMFTHLNFFEYMSGSTDGNVEDYLNEYCVYTAKLHNDLQITDAWKQNVLQNRAMIYEQMNLALDIDPGFFVTNAAEAVWNERGYFNLCSGKHRVTFLAARGKNYIPLKITKNDYIKFANLHKVKDSEKYILNNGLEQEMVFHPLYYKQSKVGYAKRYNIIRAIVRSISEDIYWKYDKIDFSKLAFFDATKESYVGRYLAKMGTEIIRYFTSEEELLDELYGTNGKIYYWNMYKQKSEMMYLFVDFSILKEIYEKLPYDEIRKIFITINKNDVSELWRQLEEMKIEFNNYIFLTSYIDKETDRVLIEVTI